MQFPALTAFYGAILALIYAVLSLWVIAGRGQFGVLHGDGGQDRMIRRIRSHANFAEYVPLILLLVAFLEAGGAAGAATVRALLLILVVARLMHPVGMMAPVGSVQQYVFRGTSVVATLSALIAAAVLLLVRLA